MFLRTDTDHAPWNTVKSNDKKRGPDQRAAVSSCSQFDYDGQGPRRRRESVTR